MHFVYGYIAAIGRPVLAVSPGKRNDQGERVERDVKTGTRRPSTQGTKKRYGYGEN